ncbi:MAG: HD domain-containing protein [Nitrosopumilus sp.]|jgi:uncharacterized protein
MNTIEKLTHEIKKKLNDDPAHDFNHIMRVFNNAKKICKYESANERLVLASVLLHDIISYPKSDKRNKNASVESANKAKIILKKYDFSKDEVSIIADAIRDHSFSRKKIPSTIEGKILQDSDRLDAIGAIGIARVFSTGGSLNRPLYNLNDPFCKIRKPNDKQWTADHFFKKLIHLETMMNTKSGKKLAKKRTKILISYLKELESEIQP